MKKLIAILALGFCMTATTAEAQQRRVAYDLKGGAYGNSVDTVDNTEAITKYLKVEGAYENLSIQVVITKISGTVGGTVIPVASNDGTNWVDISRASIAATTLRPAYKDTLTPANQTTNTKIYTFSNAATIESGQTNILQPYLYYGIKYTGTGTMSAKFRAYLVASKQ
jgi:hypothetical protein